MVNNVNVTREQFKYIKVFCLFLNYVLAVALTVSATATLAQSTTNRTTYYHNTMQGTPVAATDESGDIKWSQTYSSYGFHSGNSQDIEENSLVFGTAGHVEDQFEDRLLVYQKARYYDPALGRFLSMDPVGFHASNPQSFNRYAYVNNNPTTFVDPDGRDSRSANWAAAGVAPPENTQAVRAAQIAAISSGGGDVLDGLATDPLTYAGGVGILAKTSGLLGRVWSIFRKAHVTKGLGNAIPEGKLANHIFSGKLGKFSDTPANRKLITDLTNNKGNLLGTDRFGKSWFAKNLDDGTQLYGYTQKGVVKGAGINAKRLDIIKNQGL